MVENNFQQPKPLNYRNTIDIKSAIKEHPKTSHKLSKTIKQAEKVYQAVLTKIVMALYLVKQKKKEKYLNEKNTKNNKTITFIFVISVLIMLKLLILLLLNSNLKVLSLQ